MNKLNIASTGYPGTTESWKWLEEEIQFLSKTLMSLIDTNDSLIITGVNVNGVNVSDGYIVNDGELYKFIGGTKTDTVVFIEEVISVNYNTDLNDQSQISNLPTYYRRYAMCGNIGEGIFSIPFDDFLRVKNIRELSNKTNQATESNQGIIAIASQQEVNDGVDDTKAVTPAKINNLLNIIYTVSFLVGDFTQGQFVISGFIPIPHQSNTSYKVIANYFFENGNYQGGNDAPLLVIERKEPDGVYFLIERQDATGVMEDNIIIDLVILK